MYTYEMYGVASDNTKTYESKYGTYSKEDGFLFNWDTVEDVTEDGSGTTLQEFVKDLFESDLWKVKKDVPKKMTVQDIERELGYRVQIIDPEPEKKVVSEKKKKEVDDTIDVFGRLFGLNFKNPEDYY